MWSPVNWSNQQTRRGAGAAFLAASLVLTLAPLGFAGGEDAYAAADACAVPPGIGRPLLEEAWQEEWAAGFSHALGLAVSPDGALVAVGGSNVVFIVDAATQQMVTQLFGVSDTIFEAGVAWSPDGSRIAAGGGSHVAVWETTDWNLDARWEATGPDPDRINAVTWSPDGTRLASAGGNSAVSDNRVKIWDPENGELLAAYEGHTLGVSSLSWHPSGLFLASGSHEGKVRVWLVPPDLPAGPPLPGIQVDELEEDTAVWNVAWSPDGSQLATAVSLFSGYLGVWAFTPIASQQVDRLGQDFFRSLSWSSDGALLAGGGSDAHLFTVATGQAEWLLSPGGRVAFDPDDEVVYVADRDRLRGVGTGNGEPIFALENRGGSRSVATHPPSGRIAAPDGQQIFAQFGTAGPVPVHAWEPPGFLPTHSAEGHLQATWGVAWSPDGTMVASGGSDRAPYSAPGEVHLWDAATGASLRTLDGPEDLVFAVDFSPDGSLVAAASRDGHAYVWDAATGLLEHRLERLPTGDFAREIAWSPDGERIVVGYNQVMQVWEPDAGSVNTLQVVPEGCNGIVSGLAWSPDGALLATGSGYVGHDQGSSAETMIWDGASWDVKARYTPEASVNRVEDVAWDASGDRLALAYSDWDGARIWDLACDCVRVLAHPQFVKGAAWLTDDKIVTVGDDGQVRAWHQVEQAPYADHAVTNERAVLRAQSPCAATLHEFADEGVARLDARFGCVSLPESAA